MLVSCPFCKQLLIQAYQHVQFMYAVCFTCFKHIVKQFRIFDFERVSVLREKGAQQINKLRKVNDELRHHLETNMTNFAQSMRKRIIDEYFDRQIDTRKSLQSTISTSPSFNSQMDENPQNNTKPMPQNIKEVKAKAQENSTMQKLSIIKEKLTSTGKCFIEKIKESESYEKQVESIANYKEKMIEKSEAVKGRLSKMRGDFKQIKSELPSLKEAIRGIEIGSMLKSKFFRW